MEGLLIPVVADAAELASPEAKAIATIGLKGDDGTLIVKVISSLDPTVVTTYTYTPA